MDAQNVLNNTIAINFSMPVSAVLAHRDSVSALQIFSLIIFISSSFIALSAYILVILVLLLYFKEFKSNFYILVISLSLVDVTFMSEVLFYMVPCTILDRNILPGSPLPGRISAFCYMSAGIHLSVIGVIRLISVSVPPMNHRAERVFNNKWFLIVCAIVCWLSVPVIIRLLNEGCELFYDQNMMALSVMICDAQNGLWADEASIGATVASWTTPCAIAASHLLTWIVIYCKGSGVSHEIQQKRKRERSLLIQFSVISLTMLLYDSSFWFVPKIIATHPEGFVLITYFSIASAAVNPITYLAYNSMMKRKAKHLVFNVILRRNMGHPTVTPVGTTGREAKPNVIIQRVTAAQY